MQILTDNFRRLIPMLFLFSAMAHAQDGIQKYPDVIDVKVTEVGESRYRFDVTLSSPYDTPERYADAFRIKTRDGETLGVRELFHDHANEQPFTRSLNGVTIPDGISEVIVEGRDQSYGYGGQVMEVSLPH